MIILKFGKKKDMEITPKQQRNMYAVFVGLFALNVAFTVWNIREQHKLRKLQQELTEAQLREAKRKNGESVS